MLATETRVLIADDEPDTAETMAYLLAHAGYDVQVVHSGAEALENARTRLPHVAVVDLEMPEMDGYETARQLRQMATHASRPLVLVAHTGHAEVRGGTSRRTPVFDHVLFKPAEGQRLLAVLEGLLQRPRR